MTPTISSSAPGVSSTAGSARRFGPAGLGFELSAATARIVLVVAALAYAGSLAGWVATVRHRPDVLWATVDLHTYYDAVLSLRHSQHAIYRQQFGPWPGPFLYPPFAALAMLGPARLGLAAFRVLVIVVGHVALLSAASSSWKLLGWRRGPGRLAATLALAAVGLWLDPVQKTFFFGQVSLLLLALVLADAARPDSDRTKGALIGLAAGLKLTPGLFVVYLLLTRRFRAAAVAFGVFLGTTVIGWLALPGASVDFWLHSQNLGTRINRHVTIADATDQALRPMFMRMFGDGSMAVAAWFAVGAVVVVVGLAAAARASAGGAELVGVLLTAGVGLAVSPLSWTHHWVWVLPVVAVLADRALRSTRRLAWGAALAGYLALTLAWPVTVTADGHLSAHAGRLPYGLVWLVPHMDGQEFRWNWWQTLVGDSLLIGNLALLGWAAWYFLAPARVGRPRRESASA